MRKYSGCFKLALAGMIAGAVNGTFGAGGGMLLVPLLAATAQFDAQSLFPASLSVILPMSIVTLLILSGSDPLPWVTALPYMIGSGIGGAIAGRIAEYIPVKWLHRGLGILILYGSWRYLC